MPVLWSIHGSFIALHSEKLVRDTSLSQVHCYWINIYSQLVKAQNRAKIVAKGQYWRTKFHQLNAQPSSPGPDAMRQPIHVEHSSQPDGEGSWQARHPSLHAVQASAATGEAGEAGEAASAFSM